MGRTVYSIARRSFRCGSLIQSTLVLSAMLLIQSCGGGSSAHDLYVVFKAAPSGTSSLGNLNWFQFN